MAKRKPKPKTMTLEKMAQLSQHEFLTIGGRFDRIDEKFNQVDERFDRVDEDLHILRNDMEAGFSAISESMKTIIAKLNDIREDIVEMHDLRSRIERLEKKIGLAH